jgi:hypothetical protein
MSECINPSTIHPLAVESVMHPYFIYNYKILYIYTYIYIHMIHTHTHMYRIYIYIYLYVSYMSILYIYTYIYHNYISHISSIDHNNPVVPCSNFFQAKTGPRTPVQLLQPAALHRAGRARRIQRAAGGGPRPK